MVPNHIVKIFVLQVLHDYVKGAETEFEMDIDRIFAGVKVHSHEDEITNETSNNESAQG